MNIEEITAVYRTAEKNKEPECTHDGSECRLLSCNIGCKYMQNDEDGFVCDKYCRWITPADVDGKWISGHLSPFQRGQ